MLNVAAGVVEGLLKLAAVLILFTVLLWYLIPQSRRYIPWAYGALVIGVMGAYLWVSRPYDRSAQLDIHRFNPPREVKGMKVSSATYRRIDGILEEVMPAADQEIQGMPVKGGSAVTFDDEGGLRSWTASREVQIWGRKVPAGTGIVGDLKGNLSIGLVLPDGSLDHIRR